MVPKILRYVAFGLALLYGGLGAVFVIGETFADPGGAAAAGLVAAWLVPLVTLVLLVGAAAALVVGALLAAAVHGHRTGIGGSTAAVVLPVLALGGLFLLAGALEHRTTGPHGGVRARPSAR